MAKCNCGYCFECVKELVKPKKPDPIRESADHCIEMCDEIIRKINEINLILAGKLLIQDIDKYMAVKDAEFIVKEDNDTILP